MTSVYTEKANIDSFPLQVNEINEDGTYTVGYEASDGSFRLETKDEEGNVSGKYGFVDADGEIKIVEYSANNATGFTSDLELPAPVEAAELGEAAPVQQVGRVATIATGNCSAMCSG